jgi:hypothetical protein
MDVSSNNSKITACLRNSSQRESKRVHQPMSAEFTHSHWDV